MRIIPAEIGQSGTTLGEMRGGESFGSSARNTARKRTSFARVLTTRFASCAHSIQWHGNARSVQTFFLYRRSVPLTWKFRRVAPFRPSISIEKHTRSKGIQGVMRREILLHLARSAFLSPKIFFEMRNSSNENLLQICSRSPEKWNATFARGNGKPGCNTAIENLIHPGWIFAAFPFGHSPSRLEIPIVNILPSNIPRRIEDQKAYPNLE